MEWNRESKLGQWSTDRLEQELVRFESEISERRGAQMVLLSELDHRQVATGDGCRSLHEWTASRLDLAPENAKVLVNTSRRLSDLPYLAEKLGSGEVSYDRTAEVSNLAQTAWRLWGELPGEAGGIVTQALAERADAFPPLPDGSRGTLGQRNADALTSICSDSFTGGENGGGSQPLLTLTLDGSHLSSDGEPGETGLAVVAGPRVGPETLDLLLCNGRVEINALASSGQLVAVGDAFSYLSPRLRRHVLARDGACVIDGCQSRYRLEAHHLVPRFEGGNNHPGNLATVCWFHHHVVIRGLGYRIDPDS